MVIVEHNGSQYYYSLSNSGHSESYPLQMGNGSYTISVCENISGDDYSVAFSTAANVSLSSSNIVYRVPSQMIDYSEGCSAAGIARRLVSGKSNNYERISAVLSYVAEHIKYDTSKAKSVQSGYIPDIDSVLSRGRGICYDYAAVSAAMLRSLGYPCRMIFGYVSNGKVYHAWNEVYLSGTGWIKVMSVQLSTSNWSRVDVTFISSSTSSSDIAKYIGNGSNYVKQYTY